MFGRRTLDGPVFLGEDTQELLDQILQKEIDKHIEMSIYSFIQEYGNEDNLVIVDNLWFSYIRDIRFDYFNKSIFVPYYSYETNIIDKKPKKKDGHLFVDKETGNIIVRYNYRLERKQVCVDSSLIIYDFERTEKIEITFNKYTESNFEFSLEKVYNLYLDSCYMEKATVLDKHTGGYHVVGKDIKRFNDREEKYRKLYRLNTFKSDHSQEMLNYRDVRQFKREEVFKKVGVREEEAPYWKRILDFESYIFCVFKSGKFPIESEHIERFKSLGVTSDYMKYGDKEIKLILKGYWKIDGKLLKRKSWSRL